MSIQKKSLLILFFIIIFDQFLKIWIKTHMILGQEYRILGNWFFIHFTENEGMAFGMQLAGEYGKIILSIFRIIAVIAIGWYLTHLIKNRAPNGLILCISMILAGAIGNIIDSVFYGMIFSKSSFQVASFLPEGGGYSSFLHGKVVDMFYFLLLKVIYPIGSLFGVPGVLSFFAPCSILLIRQ